MNPYDYFNSAAPGNWSPALSGAVSTGLLKNPSTTLATASAARSTPLLDLWGGSGYNFNSDGSVGTLFVLPTPTAITELFLGHWSLGNEFQVVLWDEAGNSLAATSLAATITSFDIPSGPTVRRFAPAAATTISAFAVVEGVNPFTMPSGLTEIFGTTPAPQYTDFVNIAAPANWAAPSGLIPSFPGYFYGGQTLATVIGVKEAELATVWDGTIYIRDGFSPIHAYFVFPVAVSPAVIFIDCITSAGDPPGLAYWDEAGNQTFLYDYPPVVATDAGNPNRRVTRYELGGATISAIGFSGVGGYPQGEPTTIFGIYGTQLAGAAPLPPPFWTSFIKTFESGAEPPAP